MSLNYSGIDVVDKRMHFQSGTLDTFNTREAMCNVIGVTPLRLPIFRLATF